MNLPYWYYKGRTTTPVNIPGQGPIVLVPRMKFFAPQASVSHLLKKKMVARLPDPPKPAEEKQPEKAKAVTLTPSKSSPEKKAADDKSEPESKDDVISSNTLKAEGEGTSEEPKEKEKEQPQAPPRKRRRRE